MLLVSSEEDMRVGGNVVLGYLKRQEYSYCHNDNSKDATGGVITIQNALEKLVRTASTLVCRLKIDSCTFLI